MEASSPTQPRAADPLSVHIALSALAGLVATIVWAAVGGGFYWPAWVWFGLSIPIAVHLLIRFGLSRPSSANHALAIHAGAGTLLGLVVLLVWGLTGGGTFWPIWPLLVVIVVLTVHTIVVFADRLPGREREAVLEERVGDLTRTRRGALDVQAAELRRIERDLHDGAQARLVALSIQLGRAEARLEDDRPEEAQVLRGAREEANAAIRELRDLARGIAPPVLADRGLAAAVEALAQRAATPVTVDADALSERPVPVVETAAYFVVAEALTNASKHGGGAAARVHLTDTGGRLVVEVADEGPGGADPAGSGLTGLRHRVEALDGELDVTSPPGAGTIVRAELPCGR